MSDDGRDAAPVAPVDQQQQHQQQDHQDDDAGGRGRGRGRGGAPYQGGRGGGSKRNDDACVYVANMSFRTTWQALKDIMRDAGDVQLVELVIDGTGKPKGAALVTFASREEALTATKKLNGTVVDGRDILVRIYEKGQRPAVAQGNYTREQLNRVGVDRQKFQGRDDKGQQQQQGGAPVHHQQQQQGGRPPQQMRGMQKEGGDWTVQDGGDFNRRNIETFGEDYRRNAAAANGQQQPPQSANAQPALAQPRHAQAVPGSKLFVSNLPFDCNWKTLKDTFAQIGAVLRADIISDERGRSRGMGTVIFENPRDATTAIEEFDGVCMGDRPMGVRYDRPKQ